MSTGKTQIKSDLRPTGQILKTDFKYVVPPHQRNFSWSLEEVKQLWDDILEGIDEDRPEYFLGTIVAQENLEEKKNTIIDGQQRLATLTMIFASIRTVYREHKDEREKEVFDGFLGTRDRRSRLVEPRLTLNDTNASYFQKLVIEHVSDTALAAEIKTKPLDPSNKLLISAMQFLLKVIRDKAKTSKKFDDFLIELEEFISDRIRMIVVLVGDETDAYLIFETLNDRGLDLSISDLLKNYIFSKAGKHLDTVKNLWQEMAFTLGTQDQTQFMRHYWLSKFGIVRERDLYREMKQKFSSQAAVLKLVSELRDAADKYTAISNVDHQIWKDFGTATRRDLETLQLFGLSQFKPLLLAALEHMKDREIPKVIQLIVVISMRYNIIGSLGTGNIERAYSNAALQIRKGKANTAAKIFSEIKSIYPDDKKFVMDFAQKDISKPKLARYILAGIANKIQGSRVLSVIDDEKKVTLEHIMPKNRSKAWIKSAKDEEEYLDNLNRIGNLTLIERTKNIAAADDSFQKKKSIAFSNSDIEMSKSLCDYSAWTVKEISVRQAHLAKNAVSIWSLPY